MQHTEQNNTEYREQRTENRTEQNTENNTGATENRTEPQRTFIHTYSFDFYHEYVSIKNSDTIELYTILK